MSATSSLGATDRELCGRMIPPVGLGAMPLSWGGMLGHRDRAIETVHAALGAGCRHVDTSNIYAPSWDQRGHNERLVAEALAASPVAADVVLATKGGLIAGPDGMRRDGSADGLRAACEESLVALGVDHIDLYYLHWPDPKLPFQQQVENLAALRADGLIENIGLSNVSLDQVSVAIEVTPIAAVQNEYSPRFRERREVMEFTAAAGIALLPWSPFGGADRARQLDSQYEVFGQIADAHGVSPHRVALAWLLRQEVNVIPIPGSTRPATIVDSLAAIDLALTDAEFALLDASVPEGTSQYPSDEPDDPPLR